MKLRIRNAGAQKERLLVPQNYELMKFGCKHVVRTLREHYTDSLRTIEVVRGLFRIIVCT